MKRLFFLIALAICACHKSANVDNAGRHYLGIATDRMLKINQAVTIYDSTTLSDSLHYFLPPANRIYEWSVTGNEGCAQLTGKYKNGRADIIFHCPGTYEVTASIYDSLTHMLLGNTNTVQVSVSTDTLFPAWPIQSDDVLEISPFRNHDAAAYYTRFYFNTTKQYDYAPPAIEMKYASNGANNAYTFNFNDSVYLVTYPFISSYRHISGYVKSHLIGSMTIPDLDLNVPVNISIIWRGVTYQGTVTRINETKFSVTWDNSGAVKMTAD